MVLEVEFPEVVVRKVILDYQIFKVLEGLQLICPTSITKILWISLYLVSISMDKELDTMPQELTITRIKWTISQIIKGSKEVLVQVIQSSNFSKSNNMNNLNYQLSQMLLERWCQEEVAQSINIPFSLQYNKKTKMMNLIIKLVHLK